MTLDSIRNSCDVLCTGQIFLHNKHQEGMTRRIFAHTGCDRLLFAPVLSFCASQVRVGWVTSQHSALIHSDHPQSWGGSSLHLCVILFGHQASLRIVYVVHSTHRVLFIHWRILVHCVWSARAALSKSPPITL